MILDIIPHPKPRMNQSDKWKKRPVVQKYWAFAEELRLKANLAGYILGDTIWIRFYLPMPKSWTKKKKAAMAGQPHQQKPDLDNLLKAFWDALADEDKHIYQIDHASKWWTGAAGCIEVRNGHE